MEKGHHLETRRLGQTEMEVTHLALGGLFVSKLGATLPGAKEAVARALELGINYIDTAPGYLDSEEVLGACLEGINTHYYLSTKLGGRPLPFDAKSKDQLYFSFSESLRLLKRDCVDILLIHEPDRGGQYDWYDSWDTFYGPVCDVLEDLKQRGLIRYTGLGGTTAYQMARIIERSNYDVVLTAFNYSLLFREAEDSIIPAAKAKGMGVIAGSPLQQGWFSERFDDVIQHQRPAWMAGKRAEQMLRLYALVDRLGMPLPEFALRFVLSNPNIDTVLTGARSTKEVEQNVRAALAGPLPEEVLAELNEIYQMVPFRPFEEPFGALFRNLQNYHGPAGAR